MSKKFELPQSHIKDLLRNNHDINIGADAVRKCQEHLQDLKIKINMEISEVMTKENRKIIKEPQLKKALNRIGIETGFNFDLLRLTKADMRRLLEDNKSEYMISAEAVIRMQNVIEYYLRSIGDIAFEYLTKNGRKTMNADTENFAFNSFNQKKAEFNLDKFIKKKAANSITNSRKIIAKNEKKISEKKPTELHPNNKKRIINDEKKRFNIELKNNSKITLSELEQYLFEAANILRGPIDKADYKS